MRKKPKKLVIYLLLIMLGTVVAEGCSGGKKCGCGTDLNKAYRTPKHFR